jgi:hypothetical protein
MNLDQQELDEFTFAAPILYGAAEWSKLRTLLTSAPIVLDYLHYFGHGTTDGIGSGGPATRIILPTVQTGRLRHTPMTYAAIDGCRVAAEKSYLKALVGHSAVLPRQKFRDLGLTPRFGVSWNTSKGVAYVLQGELLHAHFEFWVDFYRRLTERDLGGSGFMFRTYEEAYAFAKTPNGGGINPSRQTNLEANGWVPVGCYE